MTDMEHKKPLPPKLKDKDLIQTGGPVDNTSVALRIFGDSLLPEDITQLLGHEPTKAYRKDEVIPDNRYHRTARTGSWLLEGNLPRKTEIEPQIKDLLSKVTSDLGVWDRLTEEFEVDIYCGLFLDGDNRGCVLSPQVLKMISDRSMTIGFDIYFNI